MKCFQFISYCLPSIALLCADVQSRMTLIFILKKIQNQKKKRPSCLQKPCLLLQVKYSHGVCKIIRWRLNACCPTFDQCMLTVMSISNDMWAVLLGKNTLVEMVYDDLCCLFMVHVNVWIFFLWCVLCVFWPGMYFFMPSAVLCWVLLYIKDESTCEIDKCDDVDLLTGHNGDSLAPVEVVALTTQREVQSRCCILASTN